MQDRSVDPERPRGANPFDAPDGYAGQGYTAGREIAEGDTRADPAFRPQVDDRDLPPDNGRRATVDRDTGEVHGSGSDIGGGNPGENFDDAAGAENGFPAAGGEGGDKTPGSLGPRPTQPTPLG